MATYRDRLPQLCDRPFITDGGIETTLIFHEGQDLPHFAAFHLMATREGRDVLARYYRTYAELAVRYRAGLVLESPTWRANADWGAKLGYGPEALASVNEWSIELMLDIRRAYEPAGIPIVISGCVGPRGDGYDPARLMTPAEAEAYHRAQVETFSRTEADMVTAITMTHTGEAIGVVRAAQAAGMPVAVSFTVETDGRLPTGQSLSAAIAVVDGATEGGPAYYMINCAHPTHFADALDEQAPWLHRIRGLRANASTCSHAELDEAETLDDGDPRDLAARYAWLRTRLTAMNVLGGCCGTDHRHIEAICQSCLAA